MCYCIGSKANRRTNWIGASQIGECVWIAWVIHASETTGLLDSWNQTIPASVSFSDATLPIGENATYNACTLIEAVRWSIGSIAKQIALFVATVANACAMCLQPNSNQNHKWATRKLSQILIPTAFAPKLVDVAFANQCRPTNNHSRTSNAENSKHCAKGLDSLKCMAAAMFSNTMNMACLLRALM